MRLAFYVTLAMLPTAALAQAGSQTTLQASLAQPAAFVHAAAPAPAIAAAAEAPSAAAVALAPVRGIHDLIETSVNADLRDTVSGGIAYTFSNASTPSELVTSPKLVHIVNRTLPESKAVPGKADVTVSMMVDPQGVPHAFRIVRSAGAAVDKDTLAAVSQYRFQPATVNNEPVEVGVTVKLQLQK